MKAAAAFLLVPLSFALYLVLETRTDFSQPVPVLHFGIALAGLAWLGWLIRRRFTRPRLALLVVGALLLGGFAWWTLGYSRYAPPGGGVVSAGDAVAPALRDSELWDIEGNPLDGGALLADGRAALLVFYRGHW